jgi:N-acetylmuramoyl-L-alanine amidase
VVTVNYVSRAQWGARPPKSTKPIATSEALFVHHTVTGTGPDEAAIVRQVQAFHMDTRKWQDIAYSWLVGQSGAIYEGRGWGIAGGHTEGWNSKSHAVCFIGNTDNDVPTPQALAAIEAVWAEHARRYATNTLRTHRAVNQTGCPGAQLTAWVAAQSAPPQPSDPEEFVMDAESRAAFDNIIRRLDNDHLPLARDTNAWVKANANAGPGDLALAIQDLGPHVARQVVEELQKRLAS